MEIDKKLIDIGISKELISLLHSKTRLSMYNIDKAWLIRTNGGFKGSIITIGLSMVNLNRNHRQMSLDIPKEKLLKFKRDFLLTNLGI